MQKILIVAAILSIFTTGCQEFKNDLAQKKKNREEEKQQLDEIEQSLKNARKITKDPL